MISLHYLITSCRWNFWTADKDIGFGVYLRGTGEAKQKVEDMVEMVANSRVNSHMVPEADSLACEILGTCEMYNFFSLIDELPLEDMPVWIIFGSVILFYYPDSYVIRRIEN